MARKGMGVVVLFGIIVFVILTNYASSSLPYGKIIFVDDDFTNEPSNHKWNTIQAAIDDADDGDIIFVFEGIYMENIFVDKSINLIGEGADKVIIDGNSRLYAVNLLADGIRMENFTIKNGIEAGIYTEYDNIVIKNCKITANELFGMEILSKNVSIINCTIYAIDWGILIAGADNCTLKNLEIYSVENKSITIVSSNDINIEDTKIYDSFCGIWLLNTTNSSIIASNISNNIIGIVAEMSNENEIVNCEFVDNFGYGILLNESNENEIVNCEFVDNFGYGIFSENSFNNTIHHNNFIENGIHAYDTGLNKWNSSIGNYWDDYSGIDENEDGIGDTPYEIGVDIDYMPLIYPIDSPPFFAWVDNDYNATIPGWQIDHFSNLQEAINAVKDGGICYVYEGIYDECKIDKPISLIGGENVIIYADEDGIFINAENVKIKGFTIYAKTNGIKIQDAENVSIEECSATDGIFGVYTVNSFDCSIHNGSFYGNVKGIYLFNSSWLTIYDCNIYNNSYFGIEMSHGSSYNFIYNCQIENNGNYGIYITQNSNENKIWHNNFVNNTAYDSCSNKWGSSYENAMGNYWDDYSGIDENGDGIGDTPYEIEGGEVDLYPIVNPIVSPPLFVWVNGDYTASLPGWMFDHFTCIGDALEMVRNGGGCFVFSGIYEENVGISKEVIISGAGGDKTLIEGNGLSAFAIYKNGVEIYNFGIRDCWNDAGIAIFANDTKIFGCSCYNNYYGIYVNGTNITIEGSNIFDNSFIGILIEYSQQIKIRNCSISGNNNGMVLTHSSMVGVERDHFIDNSVNGIRFYYSNGNTMHHNIFERNLYGCYLESSSNNLFYLNDFIENGIHAYDTGLNKWNSSIGNYWDDYSGIDENEDGIGDTPYEIDEDSIDYYPLIRRAGFPVVYFDFAPPIPYTFQEVYFTDNSVDLDGSIVNYTWDFGDGNISYEKNPQHWYADNGIYIINLTVVDNDGNTGSTEKQITVLNTPPVADFSWTPIKPTDVENVTFYSLAYDIDGSIVNYTWNLGDGSIKYGQNVSHKYVDNGNYTVNLTIRDDDGAVVWIEKNIAVFNVPPFVNFSWYPSEIYTFEVVHFSEFSYDIDGSIVNYTWDFGDGNISYEKNPQHWYADNGMYTVILTVRDDDGAITSMEKQIVILNIPPVADFSWTPTKPTDIQEITFNASLSYDSDGNIVNYTWDFESDGIIDAYGIEVIHIYDDNGTYTITLNIEDDDGATDSITKEITVLNVPPIAGFEYSVKGHPEKEPTDLDIIEFKDNSVDPDGNIVNYTWDFGDGNISYEKNPQHQYKEDGVYTITLTIVDNDGAEKSVLKAILIKNVPPVAQFTFTPEEPTDLETVHFNANSSYDEDGEIVNYTWNFGNGNYSYGIATNYSYADDGIYTVILTVKDDDEATAVISKQVEVINVKPTALFEYEPAKPRENEKIIFNASLSHDPDGSIVSYEWDFESDGIIDAYGVETEYKYKKKGSYEITLTVKDDDGEEDTYHMIIDIKEKERIPGFELSIIIIASAILIFMKRYRRGIWRM